MPIVPGIPLNKDEILKRITEEEIFLKYLQLPIDESVNYINPLRVDHKAGCRYYRNAQGRLYFKDFSKGYHWDCFNVVQVANNNCSFVDAMRIIINDFRLNNSPAKYDITPKEVTKFRSRIQITVRNWDNDDLDYWSKYEIDTYTLHHFRIYPVKALWINGDYYRCRTNDPCYAYYFGKIDGLDIFKVYFPRRKENRFFQNTIKQDYFLQGKDKLTQSSKTLVITKSYKDVICLYLMGIDAVAPTSETQYLTEEQFLEFSMLYQDIVVLGDNDSAGRLFINEHRRRFNIKGYIYPKSMGKDTADNVKLFGLNKTKKLIYDRFNSSGVR